MRAVCDGRGTGAGRLRNRLLVVVVIGWMWLGSGTPASAAFQTTFSPEASARFPSVQRVTSTPSCRQFKWASADALRDECWQPDRDSYVYDPGRGTEISAASYASPQLVAYYTSTFNFSRNFLFWAPITDVGVGGRSWYGCTLPGGYRASLNHIGGFCVQDQATGPSSEGSLRGSLAADQVSNTFTGSTLRAKTFANEFIATGCGNPSTNGRVEGPVPTLAGHTYEDLNRNGIQDNGEAFVGGFQLRLTYNSTVVATTTSEPGGGYSFSLDADNGGAGRLGEGTYTVERLGLTGWEPTGNATRSQFVAWASGTSASQGSWDFGAWRAPSFSVADTSVVEGTGSGSQLQFTVSLSAPTGVDMSIDVATSPGTAVSPADFASRSQRVTIPAGQASTRYAVDVVGDAVDELDERMNVTLSNPNLSAPVVQANAVGTIVDDDTAMISVADARAVEGDPGADVRLDHAVSLSTPADRPITIPYATSSGTAAQGADFVATSGTLVVPPMSVTGAIQVPVVEDLVDELDETYSLTLGAPDAGALARPTGTGTIVDDDTALVTVFPDTVVEGDPGGDVRLHHRVTLSTPSDRQVTVPYATRAATATSDVDYVTTSGTLVFAPLQTELVVEVPVVEDLLVEPDETYAMELDAARLVNTQPAGPGSTSGLGTILDDDHRQGTMSCRASGLALLGTDYWVSNAADHPCTNDAKHLLGVDVSGSSGTNLARLRASVIDTTTTQNFTVPGLVAPADGDRARATASASTVRLTFGLLLDARADVLASEASVQCADGVPVLRASSKIVNLRLGAQTITTDKPLDIGVPGLGVIHLNSVITEGDRITSRALWLDLPGTALDIVVSESTADVHGAPCAKGRP